MKKKGKITRTLFSLLAALLLVWGQGTQSRVCAAPGTGEQTAAAVQDQTTAAVPDQTAAIASDQAAAAVSAQTGTAMQAVAAVNVRTGPGAQWQSIGVLLPGQTVLVIGEDPSGWRVIDFGGMSGYVNGAYLAPAEAASAPEAAAPAVFGAGVVFIGDSRFVQMEEAVGENPCVWIAESGKGLDWFEEKGVQRADAVIGTGTRVLINLGVNDVRNIDRYISFFNRKAAEWTMRGASVYYASVNPVWTNPYVTKEQVEAFNRKLRANLSPGILWIDSYSWMQAAGLRIVDGLHYDDTTYRNLYAYYLTEGMSGAVPAGVPAAQPAQAAALSAPATALPGLAGGAEGVPGISAEPQAAE